MNKNLVVGTVWGNFNVNYIKRCVETFIKVRKDNSELMICVTSLKEDVKNYLNKKEGIIYQDVSEQGKLLYKSVDSFDLSILRFLIYRNLFKDILSNYDKIMLIDVRDTFFQLDPFDFDFNNYDIFLHGDRTTSETSPVDKNWIERLYGKNYTNNFKNERILCSGNIVGTKIGIWNFLEEFYLQVRDILHKGICDFRRGEDQGIFNYMYWNNKFSNSYVIPLRNSPILSLASIYKDEIKLKYPILDINDKSYNVVHSMYLQERII